jgi:hypothetical protein
VISFPAGSTRRLRRWRECCRIAPCMR